MQRKFKRGQTLMEVVVALSLVVVASVALAATTLFTQKTSRSASAQVQASKLVEENIEQVRVIRDRKGYIALTNGTCQVLDSSNNDPASWFLRNCSFGEPNGEVKTNGNIVFSRKIDISEEVTGPTKKKKVIVTVLWSESGGNRSVSNVTYFSDSTCLGGGC